MFTGSHRWQYVWSVIVTASVTVATCFVFVSASDFMRTTVVTNVKSTSESLDQVGGGSLQWWSYKSPLRSVERADYIFDLITFTNYTLIYCRYY